MFGFETETKSQFEFKKNEYSVSYFLNKFRIQLYCCRWYEYCYHQQNRTNHRSRFSYGSPTQTYYIYGVYTSKFWILICSLVGSRNTVCNTGFCWILIFVRDAPQVWCLIHNLFNTSSEPCAYQNRDFRS